MESTVSVRLRKSLLKDLVNVEKEWQIDRSEVIRRLLAASIKEWKIQSALEKLLLHKISVGKAAEESGVSIGEMLNRIKEKNIDWTNYSEEDLEKDLEILE